MAYNAGSSSSSNGSKYSGVSHISSRPYKAANTDTNRVSSSSSGGPTSAVMSQDTFKRYEKEYNNWVKTGSYSKDFSSWNNQKDLAAFKAIKSGNGRSAVVNGNYYYMDNDTYDKYGREYYHYANNGNQYSSGTAWMNQDDLDAFKAIRGNQDKRYSQFDDFRYGLDDDILTAVGEKYKSQWGDKYYYDMTDPDDVIAQQRGEMPYYLRKQYDMNDPIEKYLYDRGLPNLKNFSDMYSDAYQEWQTNQQKEYTKAVEEAQAKQDYQNEYNTFLNEFYSSLQNDRSDPAKTAADLLTSGRYDNVAQNFTALQPETDMTPEQRIAAYNKEAKSKKDGTFTINDLMENYNRAGSEMARAQRNIMDRKARELGYDSYEDAASVETEYTAYQEYQENASKLEDIKDRLFELNGYDPGDVDLEEVKDLRAEKKRLNARNNELSKKYNNFLSDEQLELNSLTDRIRDLNKQITMQNNIALSGEGADPAMIRERDRLVAERDEKQEAMNSRHWKETLDHLMTVEVPEGAKLGQRSMQNGGLTLEESEALAYQTYDRYMKEGGSDQDADTSGWSKADNRIYNALMSGGKLYMDPQAAITIGQMLFTMWDTSLMLETGRQIDAYELVRKTSANMTDEERSALRKAASQGEAQAHEFMESLISMHQMRTLFDKQNKARDFARDYPATASLVSLPLKFVAAGEEVNALKNGLLKMGTTDALDEMYDRKFTAYKSALTNTVSEEILRRNEQDLLNTGYTLGQLMNFSYQTGMSMAESLETMFLGPAGLAITGLSAASSTMTDLLEQGATSRQATFFSIVAGAAEYVTEKVSLDALFSEMTPTTWKQFFRTVLEQSLVEGSEELASDLINTTAEYTYYMLNKWMQGNEEGMEWMDFYNKNSTRMMREFLTEAGASFAGGAVSGGLFAFGNQALSYARAYRQGERDGIGGKEGVIRQRQAEERAAELERQADEIRKATQGMAKDAARMIQSLQALSDSEINRDGVVDALTMQLDQVRDFQESGMSAAEAAELVASVAEQVGKLALDAQEVSARYRNRLNDQMRALERSRDQVVRAAGLGLEATVQKQQDYLDAVAKVREKHQYDEIRMRQEQGQLHDKLADVQAKWTEAISSAELSRNQRRIASGLADVDFDAAVSANQNDPVIARMAELAKAGDTDGLIAYATNGSMRNGAPQGNLAVTDMLVKNYSRGGEQNGISTSETETTRTEGRDGGSVRNNEETAERAAGGAQIDGIESDYESSERFVREQIDPNKIKETLGQGATVGEAHTINESEVSDFARGVTRFIHSLSGMSSSVYEGNNIPVATNNGKDRMALKQSDGMAVNALHELFEIALNRRTDLKDRAWEIINSAEHSDDILQAYETRYRERIAENFGNGDGMSQDKILGEFVQDIGAAFYSNVFGELTGDLSADIMDLFNGAGNSIQLEADVHALIASMADTFIDMIEEIRKNASGASTNGETAQNTVDVVNAPQNANEAFANGNNSEGEKSFGFSFAPIQLSEAEKNKIIDTNDELAKEFKNDYNGWDKTTERDPFLLGRTPLCLRELGVPDKDVYFKVKDINHALKHYGMSDTVISNVAEAINRPIYVMKSNTVSNRVTIFGECFDEYNVPVLVVLDLQPDDDSWYGAHNLRLINAYGKDDDPIGFIKRSDILYVDPDTERVKNWIKKVQSLNQPSGLQLPSSGSSEPENSVPNRETDVNNNYKNNGGFSYAGIKADGAEQDPRLRWFKNVNDGMLRFWFSDRDAKFDLDELSSKDGNSFTLEKVLQHGKLFDYYPDIKNVKVVNDNSIHGYGNIKDDTIRINFKRIKDHNIHPGNLNSKISAEGTILHEIQHWIQRREGFPGGTSPVATGVKLLGEAILKVDGIENEHNNGDFFKDLELLQEKYDELGGKNRVWNDYKNSSGEAEADDVYDLFVNMNLSKQEESSLAEDLATIKRVPPVSRDEWKEGNHSIDVFLEKRGMSLDEFSNERYNIYKRKGLEDIYAPFNSLYSMRSIQNRSPSSGLVENETSGEIQGAGLSANRIEDIPVERAATSNGGFSYANITPSFPTGLTREQRNQMLTAHKARTDALYRDMKAEQMFRLQNQRQTMQDRQDRTKYMDRVVKTTKELADWVQKPDFKAGKYVPDFLLQSVTDTLSDIDYGSEFREGGQKVRSWRQRMSDLNAAIARYQAEGEGYMELPEDFSSNFQAMLDKIPADAKLQDMSASQLKDLSTGLTMIRSAVRGANKLHANGRYANVAEVSDATIGEMDQKKTRKAIANMPVRALDNLVNSQMLDMYSYANRLGPAGETIFKAISDGFFKGTTHVRDAQEFMEQTLKDVGVTNKDTHKWSNDSVEYTTEKGEKLALSTGQIMELYALSRRPQGMQHILGGGIQIGTSKAGKDYGNYDYQITSNDLDGLFSHLTDKQKRFTEAMQNYLSTVASGWGNEVSQKLYGVDMYNEDFYWPIKSARNNLKTQDPEAVRAFNALMNASFTNSLNAAARNAVTINDAVQTFCDHVSQMANYSGMAIPISDAFKWFNYRERDGEGHVVQNRSVKQSIERTMGKTGLSYFVNLMKDINGLSTGGTGTELPSALVANTKAAAVAGKLRVVIQQPTAIVRAMALVNPNYFVNTGALNLKKTVAEMQKYAPIAWWKDQGNFDIGTGNSIRQILVGDGTTLERIKDVTMKPAGLADNVGWATIWEAVKKETAAREKGLDTSSEEYFRKVADRFTDVINKTQVIDTILHRSEIMRSKDSAVKQATAFMAEPIKTFNMLHNAVQDVIDGKQGAKLRLGRTAAAVAASWVLNSIVLALHDSLRDREEGEELAEKIRKNFTDELLSNANLLNDIPYVRDVLSMVQGYSVDRMDMTALSDMIVDLERITKAIAKGESNYTAYGLSSKLIRDVGSLTGLPVEGLWSTAETLVNAVAPGTLRKKVATKKEANRQDLYDKGLDKKDVYYMMANMTGSTNAEKALQIVTSDRDGDGTPDFSKREQDIIAEVLGFSGYTKKKDKYGSLEQYGVQEAKKKIEKEPEKADIFETYFDLLGVS